MVRLLVLAALLLLALPVVYRAQSSNAAPQSMARVQAGLVAQDSLTTGNTAYWTFYGDAVAQNAPSRYSENSSGLHIGVQAAASGKYAGFYALSPKTSAELFHAVLALPFTDIPGGSYNTGLYVQTSAPVVNYVTCYAEVDPGAYYWVVSYAQGDQNQITSETILWQSAVNSTPLTRDCTIVTNGQNMLKAYIDGVLVVSSNTLSLNMQSPFMAFLEVQTSYSGGMRWGQYDDYYAATSDAVTLQNAPSGDTAEIVDSSNSVLASATVGTGGVALLDIGRLHLPIAGYVQLYDTAHNLVATTDGTAGIWGGDVYQVSGTTTTTTVSTTSTTSTTTTTTSTSSTTTTVTTTTTSSATSTATSPSAPTGLSATAVSSSEIDLSWTAPASDGGSQITGYTIERSMDGGSSWSTIAADTGSGGTAFADTGLTAMTTYTYRVSAINSVGASAPSGTASATTPLVCAVICA